MKNMTSDPEQIGEDAKRVAKQHDEFDAAIDQEQDAYRDLLAAVMDAAVVALPAIISPIPRHSPMQGILLLRGETEDIWWTDHDQVWACSGDSAKPFSTRQLAEDYGRQGIVDAILQISVALDAQLRGNKMQSAQKIRRRAEQIRALAVVARGLS